MLYALMGGVAVMATPGAYARDLIGGHRSAHAAAANQNTAFALAAQQAQSDRFSEVRVINRLRAVRANVDELMAALLQVADQHLLQVKAGMVGTNGDAHDSNRDY